jgi:pimeloyl-ACP methyl ester carboxylesterase
VLLSGMGDTATIWDRVQPGVARFTRVCSYDRAGEGASDPSPARASLQQTVNELHRLLLKADISSPSVLVGASWGGPIARVYASQHPERVAGIVLVDSTHEDTQLSINGKVVQPRFGAPGSPLKADLDLVYDSRENRQHPLGDMPLIVLTQGKAWNEERKRLQGDLAQLSRNSKLIVAEKSGHHIHRDDPDRVISAIREVVQAVRRRTRLN